ncbi:hypothetical protein SEA_KEANU_114 [Streptomyces phage Keanu]|nr:hypothetical protein SEA_KEANU_114 [Streptomyces phage Keanu]
MKGNRTTVAQQVEQFFRDTPRVEYDVKRVAEMVGATPNTVGQHVLNLFESGVLLRRMEGVARGRKYLYILNPNPPVPDDAERVWYDDNSGRIVGDGDQPGRVEVQWDNGHRSTVSRSDLLSTPPPRPVDPRRMRVVTWQQLPTWVKGPIATSDAKVKFAKSCTWVQHGDDRDETFYCYGPEGQYKGTFGRE